MTIYTLILYIAIAAVILTLMTGFLFKSHKSWLMTFLQNFCGSLFIFSGFVKAVDPLGTAFKMQQYFEEFYSTFKPTSFSFMSDFFLWLNGHSITISVLMIVFEIALGVMLLLGSKAKMTSWLFLLLVAFFTALTGYTYLTGYVPRDVNFFSFGQWGPYVETNMKVTDCGCFGDFLKLKPKVSFIKDVCLMLPALYFVFRHKDMHQLFSAKVRTIIVWATIVLTTVFCLRNFVWDEPIFDFRPFRAGTDIRALKVEENEKVTEANKVTGYKMTNKSDGKVVELPMDQYMKEYKNYPKEEWELEQMKANPGYEPSKISEFEVSDVDGNNMTDQILEEPGYSFMVIAYKLKTTGGKNKVSETVVDTTYTIDTVQVAGADSFTLVKTATGTTNRTVETEQVQFDEEYLSLYTAKLNTVMEAAEKAGHKAYAITAPNDPAVIEDFRHAAQAAYPFYTADDLLLKTIQRSNPGLVLWKDGKIVQKWHINKLPNFDEIQKWMK